MSPSSILFHSCKVSSSSMSSMPLVKVSSASRRSLHWAPLALSSEEGHWFQSASSSVSKLFTPSLPWTCSCPGWNSGAVGLSPKSHLGSVISVSAATFPGPTKLGEVRSPLPAWPFNVREYTGLTLPKVLAIAPLSPPIRGRSAL